MIITKKFTFQGSHIVRNCSSSRCKYSIHGHTYTVEVALSGTVMDNGGMILDFGIMKSSIKEFIKSFDNAVTLWDRDILFGEFAKSKIDKIVTLPVTPSAELYSAVIFNVVEKIIECTQFNNNEGPIKVQSVTVHETRTGKAQSFKEDSDMLGKDFIQRIEFSEAVINEWTNKDFIKEIIAYKGGTKPFICVAPEQQV